MTSLNGPFGQHRLATREALEPLERNDDVVLRVDRLETIFRSRHGSARAVRGVTFDLRRGEKLGLVGESGSGKSSLALSVLRLLEPPGEIVGGAVELNGRNLMQLTDRQMCRVRGREISLVFQDPMTALNPVKTVGAQLLEAIRTQQPDLRRRAARRMAIELLQDVQVPRANQRFDDYPHQYSGGMRQRVGIAIALANRPDVLVADEPTTALDVTTQAQVLHLLDTLVTERRTAVVLITHNLGVVSEFCDTVCVMYAGRLVERACVIDLFANPMHPYSEALLRSVPRPHRIHRGRLPSIPGSPPDMRLATRGCAFEPRCPVGHEERLCIEHEPEPHVLCTASGYSTVECHFAVRRADEVRLENHD